MYVSYTSNKIFERLGASVFLPWKELYSRRVDAHYVYVKEIGNELVIKSIVNLE